MLSKSRVSRARLAVVMGIVGSVLVLSVPASAHIAGRMTGGGRMFNSSGVKVTHGFELHCIAPEGGQVISPNNLQINWEGNHFHLETLDHAACWDDPNIDPGQPKAPFDTYSGRGTGRCNGVSGGTIGWIFTDAGEPGVDDTASITINCPGSLPDLSVGTTTLKKGNHQAHPENK